MIGRAMVVKKAERIDVECVVRGYITGSGWSDYKKSGEICGIKPPAGMTESEAFPEPIFTPTTKADTGHDMPMTYQQVVKQIGAQGANAARVRALALYRFGADYARERGIIIADTKFEFALDGDELVLVDEALTPDSSRFWPASEYRPGASPPSFDKQFVRDYLETLDWNKTAPGPRLPADVISQTSAKYREALRSLTA